MVQSSSRTRPHSLSHLRRQETPPGARATAASRGLRANRGGAMPHARMISVPGLRRARQGSVNNMNPEGHPQAHTTQRNTIHIHICTRTILTLPS